MILYLSCGYETCLHGSMEYQPRTQPVAQPDKVSLRSTKKKLWHQRTLQRKGTSFLSTSSPFGFHVFSSHISCFFFQSDQQESIWFPCSFVQFPWGFISILHTFWHFLGVDLTCNGYLDSLDSAQEVTADVLALYKETWILAKKWWKGIGHIAICKEQEA